MKGAAYSSPEEDARHIKDARGNLNPEQNRVTQKDNIPAEKPGVKPLGDKFLQRGCYRTVSCIMKKKSFFNCITHRGGGSNNMQVLH